MYADHGSVDFEVVADKAAAAAAAAAVAAAPAVAVIAAVAVAVAAAAAVVAVVAVADAVAVAVVGGHFESISVVRRTLAGDVQTPLVTSVDLVQTPQDRTTPTQRDRDRSALGLAQSESH